MEEREFEYGEFISTFEAHEGEKPLFIFKSWRGDYAKTAMRLLRLSDRFANQMEKGRVVKAFAPGEEVAKELDIVIDNQSETLVAVTLARVK